MAVWRGIPKRLTQAFHGTSHSFAATLTLDLFVHSSSVPFIHNPPPNTLKGAAGAGAAAGSQRQQQQQAMAAAAERTAAVAGQPPRCRCLFRQSSSQRSCRGRQQEQVLPWNGEQEQEQQPRPGEQQTTCRPCRLFLPCRAAA